MGHLKSLRSPAINDTAIPVELPLLGVEAYGAAHVLGSFLLGFLCIPTSLPFFSYRWVNILFYVYFLEWFVALLKILCLVQYASSLGLIPEREKDGSASLGRSVISASRSSQSAVRPFHSIHARCCPHLLEFIN